MDPVTGNIVFGFALLTIGIVPYYLSEHKSLSRRRKVLLRILGTSLVLAGFDRFLLTGISEIPWYVIYPLVIFGFGFAPEILGALGRFLVWCHILAPVEVNGSA